MKEQKKLNILLWPGRFRHTKIYVAICCLLFKQARATDLSSGSHPSQLSENERFHSSSDFSNAHHNSGPGMLSSSFPSFAGPIENITVNVGREAILECHVNHLGKYKVGWLKARDQTILALHHRVVTHNGRIDVDHDNNRIWKLKIRQIQESDRGCYMCQINSEVMKKQIGCIDVLIPPDIDDDTTSSDVVVNEGDDTSLECKARGHPKPRIAWWREDNKPFPVYDPANNHTKRQKVKKHRGGVMRLRKVQRSQMGAYLCIASNDVPPAVSKRVMLDVNFAPEIEVPSQLYGVGPGSDVTITCKVQAYPQPICFWMKNGNVMLLDGPKHRIVEKKTSPYETTMQLTVRNWQKDDESHFSCIATNSLGKADRRIQSYTFVDQGHRSEPDVNKVNPTPEYEFIDSTGISDGYEGSRRRSDVREGGKRDRNQKGVWGYGHEGPQRTNGIGERSPTSYIGAPTDKAGSSFGSSFFTNHSETPSLTRLNLSVVLLYSLIRATLFQE